MIEVAAVVIAVAFVVLVGYVVPTVIQVRKTATQAERLLSQINSRIAGDPDRDQADESERPSHVRAS